MRKIATKILYLFVILMLCFVLAMLYLWREGEYQRGFANINSSEFYRSPEGKIYVQISGSGKYELKGVDEASFRVLKLKHAYDYSNVAADKNSVYCAREILPDLDPNSTKVLGNGYISDGKISYYCSSRSEKKAGFNEFIAIMKSVTHVFIKSYDDSSYFYRTKLVESTNLEPIFDAGFARDGDTLYYKGEKLDADPSEPRYITAENGAPSGYYTDGKSLFMGFYRLDASYSDETRRICYDAKHDIEYLFEPKSGAAFANERKFSAQNMPYSAIYSVDNVHSFWPLFASKDGIYFWDSSKNEQAKISDYQLKGELKRLYADIFVDESLAYFLQQGEEWRRSKHGRHLEAQTVSLYKFAPSFSWREIGLVKDGEYGAVYANGKKVYFFSKIKPFYGIKHSVYEVADPGVIEILTRASKELSAKDISGMIKRGELVETSGEEVARSRIEYDSPKIILYITFGIAFVVIVLITLAKLKRDKSDLR
ncbi:DKNYY domain-containing protein [Campylobacter concisus]|uniref:DKNYY domain-containing protein n=1 Tax=Campylobacter concisus TaxID=199 RepID=UPI00122C2A26|nr:DKNYY domain-containing protein [Campylobacter concisus]